MNWNRVLGALLNGATRSPRRRPRRSGLTGGGQVTLARDLARLATVAIEAMTRGGQPTPAPAPVRRRSAANAPPPTRSARLPEWTASPYSPPAAPEPEAPVVETAEAVLMIRAMVAAAKADGTIDAAERQAIAGQLDGAGLSAEERDFILADFDAPLTPEALAQQAGDPMLRARIYAAAVAAMGDITAPERAWLDRLGKSLGLDRQAAEAIEERLA
ncbi:MULTISPECIES: DUF533 domain-containing protein [Roseomonadaceae]|uniref:DUF533 domain-containing protein n=1 Tax=Falsiroseomonas oleicola TaxID=2801474 RepID=A0ABS6H340_9PROT|nr:DUF533 domain-containing protein [Roseomonas oleicola]MBU8542428.1 DUF533 domain-containing protein [Roseomonas oleicola]